MKTKVLIIVENLPVPFDGRVWKEACALRDGGYDVAVLSPRGKGYTKGTRFWTVCACIGIQCPKKATALGYLWEYGWALFWEFLVSALDLPTRGFHVIKGCNPPDNIFMVALPFKLFGVKYIFDHHDANPELYYSKYERKDFSIRLRSGSKN